MSRGERTLLALSTVARTFGGQAPVQALRDATFTVAPGEMLAIVGRSGSGKSTLLNLLALLDRPTGGSYEIDGEPATTLCDRQQTRLRSTLFGFVFQQAFLIAGRTAQENVEMALVPRGIRGAARQRRAVEVLTQVGLEHRRRFVPATLSGGESQRVAIARALASSPRVLICDEPTGNLDERTSGEIIDLLRRVNSDGVAVIMATHDLGIARGFPRVLNVRDGIVNDGFGVLGRPEEDM